MNRNNRPNGRTTARAGGLRRAAWRSAPAVLLLLTAYAAWPQAKEAVRPPAQDKGKQRVLQIQYESWEYNEPDETSDYKKAIITDEDTVIHADTIRVRNKKGVQTADAAGNLLVTDPQADVTGEKAVIYYAKSRRLAVLTGNVHILVKPKKEAAPPGPPAPAPVRVENGKATLESAPDEEANSVGSARKRPAEITCDKVEYQYGKEKKYAKLTGSFKVVQKLSDRVRTLTADHAEWYGNEEKVVLHAPVHVEDTKGMKGDTRQDVTVYTKEGSERLVMGPGVATLPVEDEEEETGTPPASPPKQP